MNFNDLRVKIHNLLATHPETPDGEILAMDRIPGGLEVTVPTQTPGVTLTFLVTIAEKEDAPPKRFKPVRIDGLTPGVQAYFPLEEEEVPEESQRLVDPWTWVRRPPGHRPPTA